MQEDAALLALADQTLWVTALIAGPVLIATLVVGLVVGIIQAATSVNEQTLTSSPSSPLPRWFSWCWARR